MSELLGLAQYDKESGIWRIIELHKEATAIRRAEELESEAGEAVAITRYGKNDIPQLGEQVWMD